MDIGSESESIVGDLDSGNQSNGGARCKSVEYNNDHNGDDAKLWLRDGNNSDLLNCSNTQQPTGETNSEDGPSPAPATREKFSPSPGSTKGYGLKKWRRIRRNDHGPAVVKNTESKMETQKEKDYDSDTGRMLKRGSENLNQNLASSKAKEEEEEEDEKEKEGGSMIHTITSASSTKTNNNNDTSNAFDQDNIATTFSAGIDSEESHSHSHSHRSSSKSSTAASAPKSTLRPSAPFHYVRPRDKHMLKNSSYRLPLSPSPSDPIKKPRGVDLDADRDRDNSPLSSLESDSRSSNPVFIQTKSPLPFDYHSPPLPPHSATATNRDPIPDLVDSIFMLQSAQLALESEVQKFAEIGKGMSSFCDDLDKSGIPVSSSSFDPVGYMDHASDGLSEFNNAYCSNIVQRLERQLNEAEDRLKGKELRIAELETTRRCLESLQYKNFQEMEVELQDLFKQKVEAEVQSVVLTSSTKVSRVLVEERLNLMRSQKCESREQAPSPVLVVDAENKAVIQQEQGEKWDAQNAGTIDSEEFFKMKRGVMKFTKYFFTQLALLIFVFALFVLQLGPKSAVVVPT